MTDIAALGFAIDSSPLDRSSSSLDKLTGAAKRAEAASKGVTSGMNGAAAAAGNAATSKSFLARIIERITSLFRSEAGAADASAAALRSNAAAADRAAGAMKGAQYRTQNLFFQLNDLGVQIASGGGIFRPLLQQGSQVLGIYAGQGGVKAAFSDLGGLLSGVVTKFLPLGAAAGVVAGVFAGLTTKINETATTQVTFGEVFRATIASAAGAIGDFFKPAIEKLGSWWQQFVDWITPLFKGVVNTIVGTFVFGFNAVKDTWSLLPDAFASIFTKAMNGAIDIVQNGINAIIGPINGLLDKVGIAGVPLADLSGFKGTPSNADQKVGGIISADATAAFSTDFAGQAFNAISQKAQQLALADAAEKAKKAAKGTSDTIKGPLTDGIDTLTAKTSAWADAATSAFSNMGSSLVDAFTKGGNVAGNVLDMLLGKVADFGTSLLNSGLNSLLNSAIGGITGALTPTGGVLGNGLWGSAIFGHNAAGTNNWRGGLSWVGEQGPELVNLPGGSQVIPSGPSMRMAANQNPRAAANGNDPVRVMVEVSVKDDGKLAVIARQEGGRAAQVVVQQTVPQMIASQAPAATAQARRNRIIG